MKLLLSVAEEHTDALLEMLKVGSTEELSVLLLLALRVLLTEVVTVPLTEAVAEEDPDRVVERVCVPEPV